MKVEDEKDDEKKVKAHNDDYMWMICVGGNDRVFCLTNDGFIYLSLAGDGAAPSIELPKLLVSLLPPGAPS